jgi:hypothetical protein
MAAVSAAACGGFAPPVAAATVEGTLNFPGGFLPAMTVYARDLDGSRLHSVATHEAQSAFKLDLPPGRYTFFAEPSQAGAPQIYGAFTQAVVCRQHDPQTPCDDHSLLVVTVGASGIAPGENHEPAPAPAISDWSVPDELAVEFDQLLGHRTEPSVQELGAPRFSEYPAHADVTATPPFDFAALGAADRQQRIREAMPAAPTYAGNVAVAQIACGADCVDVILADWKSGKVQAPPALAQVPRNLPCRGDETILYRRDSRLLSLTRVHNADVVTQYFLWKPDSGTLVQTAEYQRPAERFCSLQNP